MIRKKKIAQMGRISGELIAEEGQATIERLKANVIKRLKLPKGHVPITAVSVRSGVTGDDFTQNMYTVMAQQFIVRAPRILHNRYKYKRVTKNLVKPKRKCTFGKTNYRKGKYKKAPGS